jgi:predicted RNA-binding Zn-ribbon protein involved in translation (DUF1610 family)
MTKNKAHWNLVPGYSVSAIGYDINGLECSNCKAMFLAQSWMLKFKYCPMCGTEMNGKMESKLKGGRNDD